MAELSDGVIVNLIDYEEDNICKHTPGVSFYRRSPFGCGQAVGEVGGRERFEETPFGQVAECVVRGKERRKFRRGQTHRGREVLYDGCSRP